MAFRDWALSHGYADDLEIDRIDNEGNYEPSNCRWVTREVNQRNTRQNRLLSAFGETKTIVEWLEDPRCKVTSENKFRHRVDAGWLPERAIETP